MEKFMLDTDICSYVLKRGNASLETHVIKHKDDIVISSITLGELLFGAYRNKSQRLPVMIDLFTSFFPIIDWTAKCAEEYAKIRSHLVLTGNPVEVADLMIASAAIAGNYTLVTNNIRHFQRIPGLKVVNWMKQKE